MRVPGPSPRPRLADLTFWSTGAGELSGFPRSSVLLEGRVTTILEGPLPSAIFTTRLDRPLQIPAGPAPCPLASSDAFFGDGGEPLPRHRASRVPHEKWTNVLKHDSRDALLPGCTASSCCLPGPGRFSRRPRGRRSRPCRRRPPWLGASRFRFSSRPFQLSAPPSTAPFSAYRHVFPARIKMGHHSRGTLPGPLLTPK